MDNNYDNVPKNQDAPAYPADSDSSNGQDMDRQEDAGSIDREPDDAAASDTKTEANQQPVSAAPPGEDLNEDHKQDTYTDSSTGEHVDPRAGQQTYSYTDPNAGQQDNSCADQNTEQTSVQDRGPKYEDYQQAGQQQQRGYGQGGYNQNNNGQNSYGPNNYGQNGYQDNRQPNGNYQQYGGNPSQENFNYNVGYNTGYHTTYDAGMDNSPLSMGDWVLTILALLIPCAGIVLYFVWAFGKNGNVNRRNYCRASLVISGVTLALYVILLVVFGFAMLGPLGGYY